MKNQQNPTLVIIGGGIAGMEAAAHLLRMGYTTHIVELSDHLGGHVASWHRLFPDMSRAQDLIARLQANLAAAIVHLNTRVVSVQRVWGGFALMLSTGEQLEAKALLVATGFSLFDAHRKEEYGYGVYSHVVTNADLEAWFRSGQDSRIPAHPESVGFVHCVGSRDVKACNTQCSKVCCMTAIKQAIELKERFPEAEVYCFYMDLRLFGKKYEDFYINAQHDYGVHFIRGRVSEVSEDQGQRLIVKAEDTLMSRPLLIPLDMLVLMSGMVSPSDSAELLHLLRLERDSDGFFCSKDNIARIHQSNQRGIFYAGACTGTKTTPESLAEAGAAALAIHEYCQHRMIDHGLRI